MLLSPRRRDACQLAEDICAYQAPRLTGPSSVLVPAAHPPPSQMARVQALALLVAAAAAALLAAPAAAALSSAKGPCPPFAASDIVRVCDAACGGPRAAHSMQRARVAHEDCGPCARESLSSLRSQHHAARLVQVLQHERHLWRLHRYAPRYVFL